MSDLPRNSTVTWNMNCLSSVSQWAERSEPSTHERCSSTSFSDDQKRVQVLEAEAELRRLKDRVRKAVTRWSDQVFSPADRPVKRSRLQRERTATDMLIDVRWNVTPEQLAEHLCFWRHTSALACVKLTDCLKELTPRSLEPAASKRALTLVWWDMDQMLEETANAWRQETERSAAEFVRVVDVEVYDILPLFVWEVDLLRLRPMTRAYCAHAIVDERIKYKRECCGADPAVQRLWAQLSAMRKNSKHLAPVALPHVDVAAPLDDPMAASDSVRDTVPPSIATAAAMKTCMSTTAAPRPAPITSFTATPPRRRPLGESLVTEVGMNDDWQYSTDSSMAE